MTRRKQRVKQPGSSQPIAAVISPARVANRAARGRVWQETVKGFAAPRCFHLQAPSTMKTSPMLILGIGVLLSGSLLAQTSTSRSDWQSLKIVQTANPVFPSHLMQAGVTEGEARVVINTDASGKLVDWLVVGYTHPEFAEAAVKAINAARMSMYGDGEHFVSLDKVIRTMRETGADMKSKYKETALGGLALAHPDSPLDYTVNLPEC